MKIDTIAVGPLGTNCYIVTDENKVGAIIDPGFEEWKISSVIEKNNYKIEYILLTHGHYDHFSAVEKIKGKTNARVVIYEEDAAFLTNPDLSLLSWFDALKEKTIKADITVNEKNVLESGMLQFSFIHTPGHTPGSMCIKVENTLFSGDTLFRLSIGRTDLPLGSQFEIEKSLKKLSKINEDLIVYPGHMDGTTLSYEKQNNPYLR